MAGAAQDDCLGVGGLGWGLLLLLLLLLLLVVVLWVWLGVEGLMAPSTVLYSLSALGRHNAVMGLWLVILRIFRESYS